jgi:16S rRNA processing protein RimM
MNNYVYVGKIVNTHGIKGELRIKSDFEKKSLVFIPGNILYIGKNYVPEEITSYRVHKEFDMVTFKNYNNINDVLKYLKEDVYVTRESLKLDKNEYVMDDLIGMSIIDNKINIGKVVDYVYNKANTLLVISGKSNFYIPMEADYIKNVDLTKKIIETENAKELIL